MMAAGFSLEEGKIDEFKKFVGEYVVEKMGNEAITPVIEVDAVLDVGGVTSDLADYIEKLEPFGAGNQEPVLMMKNVRIAKSTLIGACSWI